MARLLVEIDCTCRNNPQCLYCAGSGIRRVLACRRCDGKGTEGGKACIDCRGQRYRDIDQPTPEG